MRSKQKLSEIIQINPSRQLKKNDYATFVSMDNITKHQRKISKFSKRKVSSSKTTFKNGDVLLAKITPSLENGKTVFVDILKENEIGHGSTEFFVLSGKKNVTLNLFVYYIMRTSEFRQQAIQSMTGTSGRQRVQQTVFDDFKINLPTIPVQEKICSILGGLDEQITILQNQNKILEHIIQTIFKSQFIDFDGVIEFENSETGKIPKGWAVDTLSNHLIIKGRIGWKGLKTGEYVETGPYIVTGINISNDAVNWDECSKVTETRYNESPEIMLQENDILMTKDGTIGKLAFIKNLLNKTTVAAHIHVIRITSKNILPIFVFYYFKTKSFSNLVKSKISGSVVPSITQRDINNLPIIIPPKNIIEKFENNVYHVFEKIWNNKSQIETLIKNRDALLPKLMSGEITL